MVHAAAEAGVDANKLQLTRQNTMTLDIRHGEF